MSADKKTCPWTPDLWKKFEAGTLAEVEIKALLDHLSRPCPECEEFFEELGDAGVREAASKFLADDKPAGAGEVEEIFKSVENSLFAKVPKSQKEETGMSSDGEKMGRSVASILADKKRIEMELEQALMRSLAVMFTDIKGSTAFFEKRGDIAGLEMVERHNALLFPVIQSYGGTVVKTIGDAIMARFDEPLSAADAAVEMQKRLKAHNCAQPEADRIHVRIGINYGRGMLKDGDVFGDVVNTAARVESVCEPGQILVSQSMRDALAGKFKDPCLPHSREAVRGKSEALDIFRIFWDGPPSATPAPPEKPKEPGPAEPMARETVIHYQAALEGGKLSTSLSERLKGAESAVRGSEDLKADITSLNQIADDMHSILSRSTKTGEDVEKLWDQLEKMGRQLFESLFPQKARERITKSDERDFIISMDEHLVHLPWELCHDGRDFLGLRFNLGRAVSTHQPVREENRRHLSEAPSLLVVAPGHGDLPEAKREIERMTREIGSREIKINLLPGSARAGEVMKSMADYDIVHYAGHSEYAAKDPDKSGWLLKDGPLTAKGIYDEAKGPMPALVFSNSCLSGHTGQWSGGRDSAKGIFSLANAFLLSGVQHFIGTFHYIADAAGADLAVGFYEHLYRGCKIGEALREARKSLIRKRGRKDLTWASYVLYGDPATVYYSEPPAPARIAPTRAEPSAKPGGSSAFKWALLIVAAAAAGIVAMILFKPSTPKVDPVPRVVTLLNSGDFDKVRAEAEPLTKGRTREKALFLIAASYLDAGDLEGAEPYLKQLAEISAGDPGLELLNAQKAMSEGETDRAADDLGKVLARAEAWPLLRARAFNLKGRLAESAGSQEEARGDYEQALALDPDNFEALMNLALVKEREGKFEEAAELYGRARKVRANDPMLSTLADDNDAKKKLANDQNERERIRAMVAEIENRAKSVTPVTIDPWSSRPITVSVMGINSGGGIMARGGQAEFLVVKLGEFFGQTGLPVVERRELDTLLEEMNLSQSKLADPQAAIQVGRLLSARYIVTGDLMFYGDQVDVSLRVVETETSLVLGTFSKAFTAKDDYLAEVKKFVDKVAGDAFASLNLRGRVLKASGESVALDIGSREGVKPGDKFNLFRAKDVLPVEKAGRIVDYVVPDSPACVVEITTVGLETSNAKVTLKTSDPQAGMMAARAAE